jgi:hypothetical protein
LQPRQVAPPVARGSPVVRPPPVSRRYVFKKIVAALAHRVVLYGPGGIGKTSLAARAPGPVAAFDLDNSLPVLLPTLPGLDIRVVGGIQTWADLRAALADESLFAGIGTVVIDSATRAEALALAHTLETVPHEKGHRVSSIEGYGYGKGYQHLHDTFVPLLADLDVHVRASRNVVLVCHECVADVPNPAGADFIRYEPRLQSPASGKASIRLAVKEWCDHLFFLGYDIVAGSDGKAQGNGTRTIYPCEFPTHMAKSRTLSEPFSYACGSGDLWAHLKGGL